MARRRPLEFTCPQHRCGRHCRLAGLPGAVRKLDRPLHATPIRRIISGATASAIIRLALARAACSHAASQGLDTMPFFLSQALTKMQVTHHWFLPFTSSCHLRLKAILSVFDKLESSSNNFQSRYLNLTSDVSAMVDIEHISINNTLIMIPRFKSKGRLGVL